MAGPDLRTHDWKLRYSRESGDPLTDFYIPALQRCVRYDRKAGFFSSTALSAAARGIAGLIRNGGQMRLLVSAHLTRADVRAINRGYDLRRRIQEKALEQWVHPEDTIERERLKGLAWMVAQGTLEIRVAIPVDERGDLQDIAEDELFHEKVGIFTDAHGNRVAFSGSNNESRPGWLTNRESFNAFWSWREGDAERIEAELAEFEQLWADEARHTRVIDFPEAVKRKLIELAPDEPPEADPEDPAVVAERERRLEREKWLFQFVRDAPYLPNGDLLAEAFATVDLWPHQKKISDQIVRTYPEPYLLCDEVGLGKTIEAGISLKRLLLTGRVKRCLLLVPASLLTQWQEELVEKFNLNTWRYTGSSFVDAHGNQTPQDPGNPWNTHDVIIASSQLARRHERAPVLLEADDWDLVLVDEAHHARRGQPLGDEYRPNLLLQLLQHIRPKTRGMLLLTATPMQLDPIEVWDLMEAMGLGGKWGALGGELFTRYFEELRHFPDRADLGFICEMQRDYLEHIDTWDEMAERLAREKLGLVKLQQLHDMAERGQCDRSLLHWNDEELAAAAQFFRAHTPLRHYVFRHTRALLRSYRAQGLLDRNIPERNVDDRFIEFETATERELYDRIEKYIRDVYVAADEQNRGGVGFVMTIYRRRLTSSFYAIQRSLERRLKYLLGEDGDSRAGLTDEDIEEEDLDHDISEELEDTGQPLAINVADEVRYIEEFLHDIDQCGEDTKFNRFTRDLEDALRTHSTVVVFTQYTDTLDYVREELRAIYGSLVACYSGRGGERWDGSRWVTVSKEDIKATFAEGEEVKILLCTEAASEGLNLQTCSMLINYDMPWNPMKVEQRIGRIDRIGQEAAEVQVINYFYEDTVEARIHRRLGERIEGFQWVVGPLQPILAQLPGLIRDAAFADPADRDARVNEIVEQLGQQYERIQQEALKLDEDARTTPAGDAGVAAVAPVRVDELEALVLGSELLSGDGTFEVEEDGLYSHRSGHGRSTVTFRPEVYDRFPDSAMYLSYGNAAFDELVQHVPEPDALDTTSAIIRTEVEHSGEKLVAYHRLTGGAARPIASLGALADALEEAYGEADADTEDLRTRIEEELRRRLRDRLDGETRQTREYLEGRLAALRRDARHMLEVLLSIDFARSHATLPDDLADGDELDVGPLLERRLANRDIPFPALVEVAEVEPRGFRAQLFTLGQFVGRKAESLNASWGRLLPRASRIITDSRVLRDRLAVAR